jgi:hypothetical protein
MYSVLNLHFIVVCMYMKLSWCSPWRHMVEWRSVYSFLPWSCTLAFISSEKWDKSDRDNEIREFPSLNRNGTEIIRMSPPVRSCLLHICEHYFIWQLLIVTSRLLSWLVKLYLYNKKHVFFRFFAFLEGEGKYFHPPFSKGVDYKLNVGCVKLNRNAWIQTYWTL